MKNTKPAEPNIVEKIGDYLNTFLIFPDDLADSRLEEGDQAMAIALWTLSTWTFSESFPRLPLTTPYLFVNSLTPQAGKTLLIDLLEPVVLNPERTIDMTQSVLFTLIEEKHPTLFIDEVDRLTGQRRASMEGTLNGGYKPSGYVWRKIGKELQKFRTFCPKFVAGIYSDGLFDDTVISRCMFINMKRADRTDEGQNIDRYGNPRETYYSFLAEPLAEQLVLEIQAFVAEWAAHWTQDIPKPIPGISSRSWEVAMPLVQIARQIGIEDKARAMLARIFAPIPAKEKPEIRMLRKIREAYEESGADRLWTANLIEALGDGWNGKLLGNRLREFHIGSPTNITIGNRTAKGYHKYMFEDAWKENL